MRRSIFAIVVAFLLAATPVFSAQGGPKPKPVSSKPAAVKKPTTTTKVKPVSAKSTTKAPKVQQSVKSTAKPVKSTKTTSVTKSAKAQTKVETKTAKAQAKAETKTAKADAKAEAKTAKADAKAEKTAKTSTTETSDQDTTPTPDNGETVPLTPVQEKLQRNTNLASKLEKKLEGRLPLGTDLMDAALGFKNLGQFVAAVNVSTNLTLDFMELKTRMVDQKMSLGQAIQDLKATASPTIEAQRAEYDARVMIANSESETSVTASTTSTTAVKKPKKSNKKAVGGAQ